MLLRVMVAAPAVIGSPRRRSPQILRAQRGAVADAQWQPLLEQRRVTTQTIAGGEGSAPWSCARISLNRECGKRSAGDSPAQPGGW